MRILLATLVVGLITTVALGEVIGTKDGLAIEYQPDRENTISHFVSLKLDGREVPLLPDHALFRMRDATQGGALAPVPASIALMQNGNMAIEAHEVNGLDLYGEISGNEQDYLVISGTLVDHSKKDRCIDLWVGLPVKPDDLKFSTDLLPEIAHQPSRATSKQTEDARYPIFPASGKDIGLSLAIPPMMPTRFTGGLDENGLGIVIRIGISPHTNPPSQTKFAVILYRHDAAWGFRSALARYYDFYREPFFTRRVKKIGAWTTQNPSKLREKDLYAYHEAGFATWHIPGGTDSGMNVKDHAQHVDEGPVCNSLEEYEKLCELEEDHKLGIYALPYTIVGQRQILMLPEVPKTYDDAMKVLDTWSTTQPILFDGPPQAVSFRTSDELKSIIRNSGIHDEQHRLAILPRLYRGPTLTFPQNPNPKLFDNQPNRETIAKYTLDYYLPMMLQSKWVDGCYVDSLGRWCGYYNYRTDHFRYSTVPLTYAGSPLQPCLWNLQSHAEYLQKLASRLHKLNKIVFANGVHPDRVMLGAFVDVMGEEGTRNIDAGEAFASLRVAAGPKPFCELNAAGKSSPKLWASCLYMGILLNCNSETGAPLMRKYLPTIIRMNESGWQPVTLARTDNPNIAIERWGDGSSEKPLFFSLMNLSNDAASAELDVDTKALGITGHPTITDDASDEPIAPKVENGILKVKIPIDAESTCVLRVGS